MNSNELNFDLKEKPPHRERFGGMRQQYDNRSWQSLLDSPYGRSHETTANFYHWAGIDYLQVWRSQIDRAAAKTGVLQVVEVGSGMGTLGFELVSCDRGKIPVLPPTTKGEVRIPHRVDATAQQIAAYAKEKNVEIRYLGITEASRPDTQGIMLSEEHGGMSSAKNFGFTLDYRYPDHTLHSALIRNENVVPDLVIANWVLKSLDKLTLEGVLLDIAKKLPAGGVFIAGPISIQGELADERTSQAFAEAFGGKNISPIGNHGEKALALQME